MTNESNLVSNSIHFFEGVEKLLEIWFTESEDDKADLRKISKKVWEELLKLVKCEIISCLSNNEVDAYVLSESSMFVSKRRWILKTCGTTTPLQCLLPLLEIVSQYGYNEICDVFYSRKNFSRPELQIFPHRGFCEEIEYLDKIFPEGRSYCLGSINRECWYLYTFSKKSQISPQNSMSQIKLKSDPDQTIEILMQNLDEKIMQAFSKEICKTGEEATMKTGINKILPNMEIDDFLFDPCGYSMNGIGKNGEYMTIHITPENNFSYVSFESNVSLDNYAELINRVIKTFQPSKFLITIFANESSEAYETIKELEFEHAKLSRWICTDMQYCNFPSYNLLFAQYTQKS